MNQKEKLGKFDSKMGIEIFLGYSSTSKLIKFSIRELVIEESMHVVFDESGNNDLERNFGDLLSWQRKGDSFSST